jgi:ribose transport system substrate-binding protein
MGGFKKVLTILFVFALLLSLVVMVSAKEITVGLVVQNASALSQVRTMDAFKKLAEPKGWQVLTGDGKGSPEKVASFIETFVERKVDAIVVAMAELPALEGAIKMANEAGIPIYAIDSGLVPGVACNITSNNFIIGAEMGAFLADKLGYKGNIVAIGMKEHHGTRQRRETLNAVLEEYPNIKLLADYNVRYTNFYEDAQKAMEDFVTRFGDQINAVWCAWDDLAVAATKVLQNFGYSREKIFVVGADGHPHAYAEIRNPDSPLIATVAQEFEWFAAKAVEIIEQIHVLGKSPEEVLITKNVYVPVTLVTPANVPEEDKQPYRMPWE